MSKYAKIVEKVEVDFDKFMEEVSEYLVRFYNRKLRFDFDWEVEVIDKTHTNYIIDALAYTVYDGEIRFDYAFGDDGSFFSVQDDETVVEDVCNSLIKKINKELQIVLEEHKKEIKIYSELIKE